MRIESEVIQHLAPARFVRSRAGSRVPAYTTRLSLRLLLCRLAATTHHVQMENTTPSGTPTFWSLQRLCRVASGGSAVAGACHQDKAYGTHLLHRSPASVQQHAHPLHAARASLPGRAVHSRQPATQFPPLATHALVGAPELRARHLAHSHLHRSRVSHPSAPPGPRRPPRRAAFVVSGVSYQKS